MSELRESFASGRGHSGAATKPGQMAEHAAPPFQKGAQWVRDVLVPLIERGNAELQPENVAFRLDLNLDPRSTNHAHADFWLTEIGEGERAAGPRHSINVVGGEAVWVYKPGASGRLLGTVQQCGPEAIQELLRNAAEEFGKQLGAAQG